MMRTHLLLSLVQDLKDQDIVLEEVELHNTRKRGQQIYFLSQTYTRNPWTLLIEILKWIREWQVQQCKPLLFKFKNLIDKLNLGLCLNNLVISNSNRFLSSNSKVFNKAEVDILMNLTFSNSNHNQIFHGIKDHGSCNLCNQTYITTTMKYLEAILKELLKKELKVVVFQVREKWAVSSGKIKMLIKNKKQR